MRGTGKATVVGSCLLLLLVLGVIGAIVPMRTTHPHKDVGTNVRAREREQHVAALVELSKAGELSREEQARLDRAEGDPAQVRLALIEIHELRLAEVDRGLESLQGREAERWKARRASYVGALNALRSWTPQLTPQILEAGRQHASSPSTSLSASIAPAPRNARPQVRVRKTLPAGSSTAPPPTVSDAPQVAVQVGQVQSKPLGEDAFSRAETTRDQAEIRATLQRWARAMVMNDPHAESVEYSDHMDRYFLRRNVSKSFVEADKAAYLRRGNVTASFTLKDIRFAHETAHAADVELVKDVAWQQRRGSGAQHQEIRSRLHLAKIGIDWKITEEQDLR